MFCQTLRSTSCETDDSLVCTVFGAGFDRHLLGVGSKLKLYVLGSDGATLTTIPSTFRGS